MANKDIGSTAGRYRTDHQPQSRNKNLRRIEDRRTRRGRIRKSGADWGRSCARDHREPIAKRVAGSAAGTAPHPAYSSTNGPAHSN